jgi:hypothetical protein
MSTANPNLYAHHPKGSRFLAAVFATLGAFFILPVVETFYTELGGRDPLFEPVGGMSMRDGVIVSGSYELYALGRVVLARDNLTQRQYQVETILWVVVPASILIASGAILGWFAGRIVAYRLLRPRSRL